MALSFCDYPLLIHDPSGDLAGFVDRFLAENQFRWFGRQSAAAESLKQISIQRHITRVPMPCFNWPTPIQPKINTLYVPSTGATRWTVGLFLIEDTTWQKIAGALASDSSGTLAITDTRSGGLASTQTLSATLYALTPRKISQDSNPALYILPLVDERYFWQFCDLGNWTPTNGSTTWKQLLDQINSNIPSDITVTTGIESEYAKPDPLEFARAFQNAAQLVDAIAASTGRRLCCDLLQSGDPATGFTLDKASDAETDYQTFKANQFDWIAGGKNSQSGGENSCYGKTPPNLTVLFSEHVGHLPFGTSGSTAGLYAKTVSASDANADGQIDEPTLAEWTIFSTAAADITGLSSGSTPNNQGDLDNLATQIATDWYAWLKRQYEFTVIGLWPFVSTAYEDYQLIDFRGTMQTRISCLPADVGPVANWCQIGPNSGGDDSNQRQNELWPGPRLRVELKGDLTPGGNVECYILEWTGISLQPPQNGGDYDTTKTITAYDTVGNRRALGRDSMTAGETSGQHGAYGTVEWKPDAARWEFLDCQQISQKIRVSIDTGIIPLSEAVTTTSVAVMDPGGQDPSAGTGVLARNCFGASIGITNYSSQIGSSTGPTVWIVALWDESIGGYLVVDAPCSSDGS